MTIRAFIEAPAGLAAVSLRLHGGAHCRPPISRMGNKAGYAEVILGALGLRSGEGAGAYVWCEADADVRALLRAYPDAAMLRRIADIIRGWADEEPRALWERLRAERKARGVTADAEGAAGWVYLAQTHHEAGTLNGGFVHPEDGGRYGAGREATADRCHRLAEYAQIVASNRLFHVAGPELRNTGNGGSTFGGAEFATGAGEVAGRFEAMAGSVAARLVETAGTHGSASEGGFKGLHIRRPNVDGFIPSRDSIAATCDGVAGGWPPVAVLPAIPTADDLAAMLGTPGDLDGVVCYMDPPYQGTTGYGAELSRAEVVAMARDFDRLGAVVCISEAEPVIEGWHATEITGGRKGQKRTFSKQQREWLTMNRAPCSTVAEQVGLF